MDYVELTWSGFISSIIGQFFLGCIIGAGVVGSSIQRTLAVEHGNVRGAFVSSILNSLSYFFSVYCIVNNDWAAYAGTALGSTLLVMYMAAKKRIADI